MAIKDILVHVNANAGAGKRVSVACNLAERFEAHVTGLFVIPEAYVPILAEGTFLPDDFWENQDKESNAQCAAGKQMFETATAKSGVANEWRQEQGPLSGTIVRHARYSDLVIVDRGDRSDPTGALDAIIAADVIMDSGRPVLVLPEEASGSAAFSHIVVCWNTSRESIRAVTDSMPILKAADKVTVLVVNPESWASGDHGEIAGADIAHALARHGVTVETATSSSGGDVGQIILSKAGELGADLIVTGGYGHSRTREWVLGGVTDTLLHETTLPVLMSH